MEITINGLTWSIYYIAEEHFPDKKANLTYFGMTYHMSLRIYINKEMHKDILRRTIIHELTHAYGFAYGYNLNKCNEEDICRFVDAHLDAIYEHTNQILAQISDSVNGHTNYLASHIMETDEKS